MITGLSSNATKRQVIDRAARSIGIVDNVCNMLESANEPFPDSDTHNNHALRNTLDLLEEQVFQEQIGRCDASFKHIRYIFQHCPSKQLSNWIKEKLKKHKYL